MPKITMNSNEAIELIILLVKRGHEDSAREEIASIINQATAYGKKLVKEEMEKKSA